MNNKLHSIVVLFFFVSFSTHFLMASESSFLGRMATSLHHELIKATDNHAYLTDGRQLALLEELDAESKKLQCSSSSTLLSTIETSQKRTVRSGKEILKNIREKNKTHLQQLVTTNGDGLPQYLISAVHTVMHGPTEQVDSTYFSPPSHQTNCLITGLGWCAKTLEQEEYVLRNNSTLTTYLTGASKRNQCKSVEFETHSTRALSRLPHVYSYFYSCIQERNPTKMQKAFDVNQLLIPIGHIPIFERIIADLRQEEQAALLTTKRSMDKQTPPAPTSSSKGGQDDNPSSKL